MEHTNTFCGHSKGFKYVRAGGIYSNHWALTVNTNIKYVLGAFF
jgi:hypothetical protein